MRIKLLFITIILSAVALGQAPPREGRMNPQSMDAIRIWKLTEVLKLSEDQVITFLPLVQIHERRLKEIQGEMKDLMKEAHALMEKGDVSQKQVDKFTKRYLEKQGEGRKIKEEFIKSLPEYLSPEQQLLYLSFEARFRNELREYMKNERRGLKRSSKKEKRQ